MDLEIWSVNKMKACCSRNIVTLMNVWELMNIVMDLNE